MEIIIDDSFITRTFNVSGELEHLNIIKQSLLLLPDVLVVEEIPKGFVGRDGSIAITCPIMSYNTVIKTLQDFITENY